MQKQFNEIVDKVETYYVITKLSDFSGSTFIFKNKNNDYFSIFQSNSEFIRVEMNKYQNQINVLFFNRSNIRISSDFVKKIDEVIKRIKKISAQSKLHYRIIDTYNGYPEFSFKVRDINDVNAIKKIIDIYLPLIM